MCLCVSVCARMCRCRCDLVYLPPFARMNYTSGLELAATGFRIKRAASLSLHLHPLFCFEASRRNWKVWNPDALTQGCVARKCCVLVTRLQVGCLLNTCKSLYIHHCSLSDSNRCPSPSPLSGARCCPLLQYFVISLFRLSLICPVCPGGEAW